MGIFTRPPYRLDRIESLTAFIASDKDGEGVCAMMNLRGEWLPMVASDEQRVQSLIPIAEQIAKASGKKIKLVKFTNREEIREIG